jgi:hypothetical protein
MKKLVLALLILCSWQLARSQQKVALTAAGATCGNGVSANCLSVSVDQTQGGATFTITNNASGNTIQVEASGDGAASWVPFNVTPSNGTTAVTSVTSTGTWQGNTAGYTNVRLRMSTLVGGTTTVSIIQSTASARGGGGGASGGGTVTSIATTGPITGGTITTTGTVGCQTASGSQAGCLSSADWTTFNSKGSGTVTSVTGTANQVASTGGATPVLSIPSTFIAPGSTASCEDNGMFVSGSTCYATEQAAITAANGSTTLAPGAYIGAFPTGAHIANLYFPTITNQPSGSYIIDYSNAGYADTLYNPGWDGLTNLQFARQYVTHYYNGLLDSINPNNTFASAWQTNFMNGTQNINQNGYTNKTNIGSLYTQTNSWSNAQVNAQNFQAQCYGMGDCIPLEDGAVDFGGINAGSDEGLHAFTASGGQGYVEYAGTISGSPGTGATTLTIANTAGGGTQGNGRALYNITRKYNTGTITSFSGTSLVTVTGSSTAWTASTNTTTSAAISVPSSTTAAAITITGSQSVQVTTSVGFAVNSIMVINDQTQSNQEAVTITAIADTTHITANFTKTHLSGATIAQLQPGLQNVQVASSSSFSVNDVAVIADTTTYETVKITAVPDGTHITAVFTQPHATGATVADTAPSGSQAGDCMELVADTWTTSGGIGFWTVVQPLRQCWPVVSVTNATTLTIFIGFSGGYNGSNQAGGSYNLYPMALSVDVTNAGTNAGNTIVVEPNKVAWTSADSVAMALGPFFKFSFGNFQLNRYWPAEGVGSGGFTLNYNGVWSGNDSGMGVVNNTSSALYNVDTLGGHLPPPASAFNSTGVWSTGFTMNTGPANGVLNIGCPPNGCAANRATTLINVSGSTGSDLLKYDSGNQYWQLTSANQGFTWAFDQNGVLTLAKGGNAGLKFSGSSSGTTLLSTDSTAATLLWAGTNGVSLAGSAPAVVLSGTTPYLNASAPLEQRKQCSFALTTSTLTLALSPVSLCTMTLPNAAVVWRVNCQGGWSVPAGTTPTFAVGNTWSQTPSGVFGAANIDTTNAGVGIQGTTASTSNGNILATGSLTTSATIFTTTWWTTFTGSATSGTYSPTVSLTGTSATGTLVGFCTIQ